MAVTRLLFAAPVLIVAAGTFAPGLTSATPLPKGQNVVGMAQSDYNRDSVTLHAGDRLELANTSSFLHVVTLGRNSLMEREPGAPRFGGRLGLVPMPSGAVYLTKPWDTPGVYHLTCALYPSMNLTVVVVRSPAAPGSPGIPRGDLGGRPPRPAPRYAPARQIATMTEGGVR